jgi:hypothetical protein
MGTPRIETLAIRSTICLTDAIALIAAGCTHGDAAVRKVAPMKASTTQHEKPITLRYSGGPNYPMYPQ